jgi:acyl-CoA synthetase (AMP-forming)/AMP-acid ligase II/thioesterase domain-containing protein
MNLWQAISDQAARHGPIEAILAPGRSPLRFADLPSRLDEVRITLSRYGVGRGDLVAVALPSGPEMAVCFLGVAACATIVPLNPDFSPDEFSRYLDRLRPAALVLPAGSGLSARRAASARGVRIIDLVTDVAGDAGTFDLRSDAVGEPREVGWNSAEDIPIILVTSGSTGAPKLVPRRQRHLLAFAEAMEGEYRLGTADRCLHVMPMFHGHGLLASLLAPLLAGGGVVCPDRLDVASFFAHLETFRPTWYTAGYTIHHAVLDHVNSYRDVVRQARLRFIRSGSGRLDPKVIRGLEAAFGAPVVERYGMSEAGNLTYNPLPPAVRKPGTVGIPTCNEVQIIDEHGVFLGPHRDGEVVARGPSVFDGYWDDPDATATAFIDGWFRTGDVGRFDDDGYLTITGRVKDLINRGGEKIAPLEVEAILAQHPAVGEVCVFAIPHPTLGEEIAAAVVPTPDSPVAARDIRDHARARLVDFKVPRRIFFCAALPRGASGKVQRRTVAQMCLATPTQSRPDWDSPSSREPTGTESEVQGLWRTVLGVEVADLDQDFFLAGGDSLKAAALYAQIRSRFGVSLGLRHVFDDGATIAGLARLVERAGVAPHVDTLPASLVPIKTDGDRPPLFAVPGSGGDPVGFVHLGRLLDRRQPLYGIQSRGLDGLERPMERMEDIARENLRSIKTLQPEGPYYVTGACFGARVAYEMARQLEAAGEPVGLLMMLDPSPPFTDAVGRPRGAVATSRYSRSWPPLVRFLGHRLALQGHTLLGLRGEARRAYLRAKLAMVREMIRQRDLFRGDRSGALREGYEIAVHRANRRAGRAYVPRPFSGRVVLCLTRDRPVGGPRDYRRDWFQLVPQSGAPVYVAGRDSGDMLKLPHVFELAERVNAWLESVFDGEARSVPNPGVAT